MRKNCFLMATMMFVAMSMVFASCKKEKTDDPKDPSTEQNGGNQTEDETPDPVTYTLTVLSSNEEMGTITGSGTYEEGTEVTLTATPTSEGYAFVKWSDENTDNPRALTVAEDLELTAIFDYAAVDLGLSVKWATCNVGATKPKEYGNYYAWGETEPNTTYNWSSYKWCNGSSSTLSKYNTKSSYGTVDNKTVLDPEDDAAHVNWGGAWRMPTDAECQELIDNCTWTYVEDYNGSGVNGYEAKGTNGNSIFFPVTNYYSDNTLYNGGNYSYYWSSSISASTPSGARQMRITHDSENMGSMKLFMRSYGCTVRPVR